MSRLFWVCCLLVSVAGRNFDIEIEDPVYDFSPRPEEVERCMKDSSQCVEFSTYPNAHMKMLIASGSIKQEWFQEREDEAMKTEHINSAFQSLCQSYSSRHYPTGGMTREGQFIYIVQMKINGVSYYQPIHGRTCAGGEFSSCRVLEDTNASITLPEKNNHSFLCEQERGYTKLVGVDTRGKVVRFEYEYNRCCTCKY